MPKIYDPTTESQIHRGRREKLRQSFKHYGLHTFNETQVLEFALGMVMPRIDTNPIAHRLIGTFGGLDGVISAHPNKITEVAGIGNQGAFFLSFLKEFVTYAMSMARKDERIKTPADASALLRDVMKTYPVEHFVVVCLDKCGTVVLRQNIRGNMHKVYVSLNDIVETIFRVHAVSIVCAHNHLDEIAVPSDADIMMTRALVNVLCPLGIDLLDHIIFGLETEFSFFRSGVLDVLKREHKAFCLNKDYEEVLLHMPQAESVTSQNNRPAGS